MYLVNTSIEIAASPEAVREKFLDFPQLPVYHPSGFFKSIGPATPNKPFQAGDKLHVVLEGATFDPLFLENSESCFRWRGNFIGIFIGEHSFRFEPSTQNQGGTTFLHGEKFGGILGFLMGEGLLARSLGFREKTKGNFERYNRDLKTWCERGNSGN